MCHVSNACLLLLPLPPLLLLLYQTCCPLPQVVPCHVAPGAACLLPHGLTAPWALQTRLSHQLAHLQQVALQPQQMLQQVITTLLTQETLLQLSLLLRQ